MYLYLRFYVLIYHGCHAKCCVFVTVSHQVANTFVHATYYIFETFLYYVSCHFCLICIWKWLSHHGNWGECWWLRETNVKGWDHFVNLTPRDRLWFQRDINIFASETTGHWVISSCVLLSHSSWSGRGGVVTAGQDDCQATWHFDISKCETAGWCWQKLWRFPAHMWMRWCFYQEAEGEGWCCNSWERQLSSERPLFETAFQYF